MRVVPSNGLCGFNQSELIFANWIVIVSKPISVSSYGVVIEKSCSIGNNDPFWELLHIVVSNHKNVFFFQLVVSNRTKVYLLRF